MFCTDHQCLSSAPVVLRSIPHPLTRMRVSKSRKRLAAIEDLDESLGNIRH